MTDTRRQASAFQRSRHEILGGWLWFFLVLFSYYSLKPLRDGLGTHFAGRMSELYLATLVATLISFLIYSYLVARLTRRRAVLVVHQVFAVQMLWFSWQLGQSEPDPPWLIATFYVWVSVFNLFVVTMFWSVMADRFTADEGKNWFGSMAAAGSVGSLCGSGVAWLISSYLDTFLLLPVSLLSLEIAVYVAWSINSGPATTRPNNSFVPQRSSGGAVGGTTWSGLVAVFTSPYLVAIGGFVVIGKFHATFVYNFLQLLLRSEMPDATARTELFSQINFWSQSGSMLAQALLAAAMLRWLGIGWTLAIPGMILAGLFLLIYQTPSLNHMVLTQVVQQILGYGILVPAQHVLFTVVTREQKYKAKAFIDNVLFRGSDTVSAMFCDRLIAWGYSLGTAALLLTPVIAVWTVLGGGLGRAASHRARVQDRDAESKGAG